MSDYIAVVNLHKPENLSDEQRARITRATLTAHKKKIDLETFSKEVCRFFGKRN